MKSNYTRCISIILLISFLFLNCSVSVVYAQEVKKILSIEAYDMLNTVPDTYLIDIRTRAEYQYVGHPDKAYHFPYMFFSPEFVKKDENYGFLSNQKNKDFIDEISKAFKKTDNLLIISRDGTLSAIAADELLKEGFKKIFDVYDGFEGPEFPSFEDNNRHKYYRQLAKTYKIYGFQHRRHYGWQWWGLPWSYEIDTKYVYPPDLKSLER